MRHAVLAFVSALMVFPAIASGPRPNVAIEAGSDLKGLCEADLKSGEYAMCYAFNSAVLEVMENNSIYGVKACIPPLVDVNKAVDLPSKWLLDHPDRSIEPASKVVAEAYAVAFPCKNSN
jgi:hypothetical protein